MSSFNSRGVDDEGFPEAEFPHIEVSQAKFRIGEIGHLVKGIEEEIGKKMGLYFAMSE